MCFPSEDAATLLFSVPFAFLELLRLLEAWLGTLHSQIGGYWSEIAQRAHLQFWRFRYRILTFGGFLPFLTGLELLNKLISIIRSLMA